MKKIIKLMKIIIISLCMIYLVNITLNVVDVFIPINLYSISTVSLLGIPGLISLIAISLFL